MEYGERLAHARTARGLTQHELEAISRVKQGSISKIERGDQGPSKHDVPLCFALKISPFWLVLGEGDMELEKMSVAVPTPRIEVDVERDIHQAAELHESAELRSLLDLTTRIEEQNKLILETMEAFRRRLDTLPTAKKTSSKR